MGLFNRTGKGKSKEQPVLPWQRLDRLEQLDEIIEISKSTPVFIFKHSTRCGISRMVLREFEASFSVPDSAAQLYFLDLLAHRDISNEIALRFQVLHQSPQLLIIKNGATVFHTSHYEINTVQFDQFY